MKIDKSLLYIFSFKVMKIGSIAELLEKKHGKAFWSLINNKESEIKILLTDSRNLFSPEETLFFAIKTERGNDGHKYIKKLYESGVSNFIVEYIPEGIDELSDINIIKVNNSIDALNEIGKTGRSNANKLLAITGSRGKTTLKEILFQLLEPDCNISRSPRSYNSKIGVPLSLWQIKENTDLAIIEAGISEKGEMDRLASVIMPDTVIITNIGQAHSQGFASLEEKTKEKLKLTLKDSVKKVIYPYNNSLIRKEISKNTGKIKYISWSFQSQDADLYIEEVIKNGNETEIRFKWESETYEIIIRDVKKYDIENISAALTYLLSEDYPIEIIKERFRHYHPINTRLNVSDGVNGCSVILDSYTSDLSSLLPALEFMNRRKMPNQKTVLIASDLTHETHNIEARYKEMATIIKGAEIGRFIGIGKDLSKYRKYFPSDSMFFADTRSFLQHIRISDFNEEIILLKGSPNYTLENIYQQLEVKKHETVLEVNLDAILRNYNYFRHKLPSETGIIAMVKAWGYGTGSYEIAKTLQDAGASYLAVAALDEGIELRNKGIRMPIMVMNPRSANYTSLFNYQLEPVIYSLNMLKAFTEEAERKGKGDYPIHVKLDTGMHRMGFIPKELYALSEMLQSTDSIKVSTIFSHLATADCLDMDQYTISQLNLFEKMSESIISKLGYKVKRHILNSAGILRFPEYHYDYARLGIGLYGANTLPEPIEAPLSTVCSLKTVIICIRELNEGEAVGYGRKGKITRRRRIATLPIGYADGMNRRFGNGGLYVWLNGRKVPTIGNICMDAMMIDVTDVECEEGDNVEIFGERMSLLNLSDHLDTIPYEILTSISPRVKRIYYRE